MVRLNCNKSQNCISHCGSLNCVVKVEAKSTEVGRYCSYYLPLYT